MQAADAILKPDLTSNRQRQKSFPNEFKHWRYQMPWDIDMEGGRIKKLAKLCLQRSHPMFVKKFLCSAEELRPTTHILRMYTT